VSFGIEWRRRIKLENQTEWEARRAAGLFEERISQVQRAPDDRTASVDGDENPRRVRESDVAFQHIPLKEPRTCPA